MKRNILIGGEWREARESFTVRSPYSGETLAEVGSASAEEAEEAIAVAEDAAKKIRRLERFEISRALNKISAEIKDRRGEFVETIVKESAKPIVYARGEVDRAIETFRWAAGEAERFAGEVVPLDTQASGREKTGITNFMPRGVVYGITPFNFPLNLVAHKVAPALASKNAIIIKPSEKTPLTSLLLGEVFLNSGLPEYALQIVPMDVKYMETILSDERVKMISFTGSAEVGWKLKSMVGQKAIALELGGNAPVIVDETANVEKTVSNNLVAAFAYSGQVCISAQRFYVQEKIFDEWTEKFVAGAENLKKGDPIDESTRLSVMIDEKAARRAEQWINEALDAGAEKLCGGGRDGAFLEATVLTKTDPEMRVVAEEVFAPVAVVEKFTEFEQAVDLANQSKYGLQAGVFTESLARARYAAENLEFGGVIVNEAPSFRVDNMPYGGIKSSGFGREGLRYAMQEMSEIRLVVIN